MLCVVAAAVSGSTAAARNSGCTMDATVKKADENGAERYVLCDQNDPPQLRGSRQTARKSYKAWCPSAWTAALSKRMDAMMCALDTMRKQHSEQIDAVRGELAQQLDAVRGGLTPPSISDGQQMLSQRMDRMRQEHAKQLDAVREDQAARFCAGGAGTGAQARNRSGRACGGRGSTQKS